MRVRGALLAACLLAPAAAAQPVVFSSPQAGESLRAGTEVELRWTGVPSDAQEMELLLSLDGGRAIALRLTSEIPAAARTFSWRIPNLGSSRASLVLRAGRSGRETVVGASAPFTILPDESVPFETVTERAGELWLASPPDSSDPFGPVGAESQPDGWSASGPWGTPASISSSNWLPFSSRARVSPISASPARRQPAPPALDRVPAPSPTLRI